MLNFRATGKHLQRNAKQLTIIDLKQGGLNIVLITLWEEEDSRNPSGCN
jgi:hypothetical protein